LFRSAKRRSAVDPTIVPLPPPAPPAGFIFVPGEDAAGFECWHPMMVKIVKEGEESILSRLGFVNSYRGEEVRRSTKLTVKFETWVRQLVMRWVLKSEVQFKTQ
jgi:hypothetical protein